jgi:hypothetical protein
MMHSKIIVGSWLWLYGLGGKSDAQQVIQRRAASRRPNWLHRSALTGTKLPLNNITQKPTPELRCNVIAIYSGRATLHGNLV